MPTAEEYAIIAAASATAATSSADALASAANTLAVIGPQLQTSNATASTAATNAAASASAAATSAANAQSYIAGAAPFGLFVNLGSVTVPAGVNVALSTGYSVAGEGAGFYVSDSLATAALAASHPRFCKADAAGRYFRLAGDYITAEQAGASSDGVGDDYAAFAAADAAAAASGIPLVITRTHRLNTSYTTTAALIWSSGQIKPAAGVTLTIGAGLDASAVKVFDTSLGGSIAFNTRHTPWGWAEWWGLTAESTGAAAANVASINAAITALRETRLLPRTYYTSAAINLNTAGKRLIGSGHQYDGATDGRVTRIISTSATAHILYFGATSFTTIAALPRGIHVSDLFLTRSVAPDVTSGCAGVFAKYSLFSTMERVKSDNSLYGFQFGGNVHLKATDCHATRSLAGTGGTDIFYGFFIDGSVAIGANGSNASLYLIRCNAEGGVAVSNSVGFFANQKMTDLFLHFPETSNMTTGIELVGAGTNTTLNYDTIDIEIIAPKLDTFGFAGLYIHDLNKFGSVEVKGGYYGAKAGATAAVNITTNQSAVRVDGGQFLMGVAPTCFGVRVFNSMNVLLDGCAINEADAYAVVLDGATNCRAMPIIKNHSAACDAAVALLNTCTANYVAPMVSGGASKVAVGIQAIGTLDARNEYNCSGIDSTCITGGAGNKLLRNAVQTTATGLSGTNLVSGVMT